MYIEGLLQVSDEVEFLNGPTTGSDLRKEELVCVVAGRRGLIQCNHIQEPFDG